MMALIDDTQFVLENPIKNYKNKQVIYLSLIQNSK